MNAEQTCSGTSVLELYSGIGGMHFALKQMDSSAVFDVVQAVDINTSANSVYRYNFPDTKLTECLIETVSIEWLDSLSFDMILMSPPCQPFTRVGKKRDENDPRTRSFLHLISLIPRLKKRPAFILLENVKGFEVSETRDRLMTLLHQCDYTTQELLLTPLQFGVPNSRLRYYLLAKLKPHTFCFTPQDMIMEDLPETLLDKLHSTCKNTNSQGSGFNHGERNGHVYVNCCHKTTNTSCDMHPPHADLPVPDPISDRTSDTNVGNLCDEIPKFCDIPATQDGDHVSCDTNSQCGVSIDMTKYGVSGEDRTSCTHVITDHELLLQQETRILRLTGDQTKIYRDCRTLAGYLERRSDSEFVPYLIPDKELRRFVLMDVVLPSLRKSACFAKRYGHYMEGAGSVLQMSTDLQSSRAAVSLKESTMAHQNKDTWGEGEISVIRSLKLRYFTPREIANLLCFPQDFEFPTGLSTIQKYRLLGNSLNVHVVSVLIQILVTPGPS